MAVESRMTHLPTIAAMLVLTLWPFLMKRRRP